VPVKPNLPRYVNRAFAVAQMYLAGRTVSVTGHPSSATGSHTPGTLIDYCLLKRLGRYRAPLSLLHSTKDPTYSSASW
jgi:hypothetical protein